MILSGYSISIEGHTESMKSYRIKKMAAVHIKGKVITGHTHPTMFNPFSMKDASVGRFPLSISSTKTPKL
jgi:hypothetical protein